MKNPTGKLKCKKCKCLTFVLFSGDLCGDCYDPETDRKKSLPCILTEKKKARNHRYYERRKKRLAKQKKKEGR